MGNLNLIGAVGIKLKPDASGFRGETKREVMAALSGVDAEVPVTPVVESGRLRSEVESAARRAGGAEVDVQLKLNDKHVASEMKRVTSELESFAKTKIDLKVKTDEADAAIREHRDRLDQLQKKYKALDGVKLTKLADAQKDLARAQKELKSGTDSLTKAEERLAAVSKKIEDGDKTARTRRSFEAATRKVDEYKKKLEELTAANDVADQKAQRALRAQSNLRDEMQQKIEQEKKALESSENIYKIQTKQYEKQLNFAKQMRDLQTGTSEQVRNMLEDNRKDGETLTQTFDRIAKQAGVLDQYEFKNLRKLVENDFSRDKVANLRVEADTAYAEAQLQELERTRTVRVLAHVDSGFYRLSEMLKSGGELDAGIDHVQKKYAGMFSGGSQALTGIAQYRRMTDMMVASVENMDTLATNSARTFTMLGSAVGALTGGIGSMAVISRDAAALSKGVAILPAGLMTLGFMAGTTRMALKDLGKAMLGDTEVMAELNARAGASAKALGEMWSHANKLGKQKFFEESVDSIARLKDTTVPLAQGWEAAYKAQGKFFDGMLQGVNAWFDSGDMAESMGNLALALDNGSRAARPFMQALLDITDVGMARMPAVTNAMSDAAESFAAWARHAKETGSLDAALVRAWEETKNLASITKSTVGIIGEIGKAAEAAGYGGLAALADGAKDVREELSSDLYQGGMTNIFAGVKKGAGSAASGFHELTDAIMNTSKYWGKFAELTGSSVEWLGTNFSRMLQDSSALPGVAQFLGDVNEAALKSGGLVRDMGEAFGQSATTAGELVLGAQRISAALFSAWADMGTLTDGINAAIPVVTKFTASLVGAAHVPLGFLSEGLGTVLKLFADMPGPVQTAVLGLTAYAAVMAKLKNSGNGSVIAGVGTAFPALGRAVDGVRGKLESFRSSWDMVSRSVASGGTFDKMRADLKNADMGFSNAERSRAKFAIGLQQMGQAAGGTGLYQVASHADRAKGALQGLGTIGSGAMTGLKGAAGSLIGFLGGPWGIAFMAAGAVITHFAAKHAEAKQKISDFRGTLEETGDVTTQTVKVMSDSLNESWGKVGEAAEQTGMSQTKLSQDIANSADGDWSKYRGTLNDAYQALMSVNSAQAPVIMDQADLDAQTSSTADSTLKLSDRQQKLADMLHGSRTLTAEMSQELFGNADAAGMSSEALRQLIDEYDKQRIALVEAKRQQEEYAKSMDLTTSQGQQLSSAMETINSATASSAEKATAFGQAMDVATGGTRSFLNSITQQESAMNSLAQAFATVNEHGAGGAGAMVEYTNALGETSYRLNTTVSDLGQLDSALQSSYDSTVQHAQAVYDNALAQGKSVGEASRLAADAMGEWRSSAQQQLQDMGADAEQAKSYLTDLAGEPYMATVTFMGKTDDFLKAQAYAKQKGQEFDGEAFTAFLQANPDMAYEDIQGLMDRGLEWESARFSATFGLDREALNAEIQAIADDGKWWDEQEYSAALKGDSEPFLEAIIDARTQGVSLDEAEFRPFLGLDKDTYDDLIGSVKADGEEIGSAKWVARVDLENPGFAEKYYAADQSLHALTDEAWEAYIKSNLDKVKKDQEDLMGGLNALNGTQAEVTVKSNAAAEFIIADMFRKKMEGMSDLQIRAEYQAKLGIDDTEWNSLVDGLPGEWETAKAPVEQNKAKPSADLQMFNDSLIPAGAKWAETKTGVEQNPAKLNAQDNTAEGIDAATQNVNTSWGGKTFFSKLDSLTQPFMNSLGIANLSGTNFSGTTYKSTTDTNIKPASDGFLQASALGIGWGNRTDTSTADTNPAPAKGGFDMANSWGSAWGRRNDSSTIDGNTSPALGAFSTAEGMGNNWARNWYNSHLGATSDVWGGITSATSTVNANWTGKSFQAFLTVVAQDIGRAAGAAAAAANAAAKNADGGYYPQVFANGGFASFTNQKEIHQAMLAPGSNMVRIWAEPETGGEAYIPLASSKRSRSMKILGQVADKFGVTINKYANGGIEYVGGVKPGQMLTANDIAALNRPNNTSDITRHKVVLEVSGREFATIQRMVGRQN